MQLYGLFDKLPPVLILSATVALAALSFEGGFRVGRWRSRRQNHEQEVAARVEVGVLLGLVSFILAVTFWVATTHFDAVRQAKLSEANAIRTTYLRADLLPEPYSSDARHLLREYVDIRLGAFRTGQFEQAISRSEELHNQLWSLASAAKDKVSSPIFAGYFIQSLNDMIALHTRRVVVGMEFRIPSAILIAIYVIMSLAAASIGCHAGLTGASRPLVSLAFILISSAVILLIADLDNPRRGALKVSQQVMEDLRRTMNTTNH
jgi:Flp pilus assembly pilin Flp